MSIDNEIIARSIMFLSRPSLLIRLDPFSDRFTVLYSRLYANYKHFHYPLIIQTITELCQGIYLNPCKVACNEPMKSFTFR